jgi:hypothetical protein
MSYDVIGAPPRSLYVIGGLALAWNLVGLMQYVMGVTMTDAALAALPANHQAFINETPQWATAAFAIATNAGVLGCILLLLRKAWAYPVFIISLLGVLAQNVHALILADGLAIGGMVGVALSLLVIVVGTYLILYSKRAKAKGWLS